MNRAARIAIAAAAYWAAIFAFALLMLAEAALARVLSGLSLAAWLRGMGSAAGAVGLLGQMLFALLPWWVRRRYLR